MPYKLTVVWSRGGRGEMAFQATTYEGADERAVLLQVIQDGYHSAKANERKTVAALKRYIAENICEENAIAAAFEGDPKLYIGIDVTDIRRVDVGPTVSAEDLGD